MATRWALSAKDWVWIGTQAAVGTVRTPELIIPLLGAESVDQQLNWIVDDQPDGAIWDVWEALDGQWWAGDIQVPLHPDLKAELTAITQRDLTAPCLQPKWFSTYVIVGNLVQKAIQDCKCASARFRWAGREIPSVTITAQGLSATASTTLATKPSMITTPGFTRSETSFELRYPGEAAYGSASSVVRSLEFTVDHNAVDPGDLVRWGSVVPVTLLATQLKVTGTLELDVNDDNADEIAAALNNPVNRWGIRITMTRGGVTWQFTLDQCVVERPRLGATGDKTSVEAYTVDFRARSPDGTTSPIVVS